MDCCKQSSFILNILKCLRSITSEPALCNFCLSPGLVVRKQWSNWMHLCCVMAAVYTFVLLLGSQNTGNSVTASARRVDTWLFKDFTAFSRAHCYIRVNFHKIRTGAARFGITNTNSVSNKRIAKLNCFPLSRSLNRKHIKGQFAAARASPTGRHIASSPWQMEFNWQRHRILGKSLHFSFDLAQTYLDSCSATESFEAIAIAIFCLVWLYTHTHTHTGRPVYSRNGSRERLQRPFRQIAEHWSAIGMADLVSAIWPTCDNDPHGWLATPERIELCRFKRNWCLEHA